MAEPRWRASRVRWSGTVSSRDDARPLLADAGDAVLVKRGRPRSLVLKCPCGCGEELTINLDSRAGPAWRVYRGGQGTTLYPSVWRESGCRSHFIVWEDRILLCDDDSAWPAPVYGELEAKVISQIPEWGLRSFTEIADALGVDPWSVFFVCRQLVLRNALREGTGNRRGQFGRQ